jgi:YD repeat-containing protein
MLGGVVKELLRRTLVPILVLLAFAAVLITWVISVRSPDFVRGTDWQRDHLRGRVEMVVSQTSPMVSRFGEWLEAAQSTDFVTLYNTNGFVTDYSRFRTDNTLDYRIIYSYDGDRLIEELTFDNLGNPLYRWSYSYNASGQLLSLTGYGEDGRLDFRTLYTYDRQGRLIGETTYHAEETLVSIVEQTHHAQGYTRVTTYYAPDGTAEYRIEIQYNTAGNRLRETVYSADNQVQYQITYRYNRAGQLLEEITRSGSGALEYRLVNRYDNRGNLIETTEYGADNQPFYRYSYSYDRFGNLTGRVNTSLDGRSTSFTYRYTFDRFQNWITQETLREVMRFGQPELEPVSVTRRTISYH